MVSTAAMVIILSGFNGIEGLVFQMFSSFESDIEIEAIESKSFNTSAVSEEIYLLEDVANYSKIIEEIAIIKNHDNFIIGTIKGVDEAFLEMCEIENHLLDGKPILEDNYGPVAMIGGGAIENLDGYIYQVGGQYEYFTIYAPNKGKKISQNQMKNLDAFSTSQIPVGGVFGYNNDVDQKYLLVPFRFAQDIFNYEDEISKIELDFNPGTDLDEKKEIIQAIVGPKFSVKTSFEQNQLIFETSQSEKLITTLLLGFIFFLATFNMVASITMLVIEKKDNLSTLSALGAKVGQLQQIFFYEGLLINFIGLLLGLLIGYGVCYLQLTFGLIRMENSTVAFFPIGFKIEDLLLILGITMSIGTLAAYLPSRFLIKKIIK
jgi:lipoprotein-releasing system permease protein